VHRCQKLVDDSLQSDRFLEPLDGAFSLLALLLAAIGHPDEGLYGIPPDEGLGISPGLGAEPGEHSWRVPARNAELVLIGITIWVPCALCGNICLSSSYFGLA